MNEFDDLDQLEREFGPALRLALRHVAAEIPDDASAWPPEVDEGDAFTASADDLARGWRPRRRWMLAAAATIVVLALGLLAVAAFQDPDSVQTDTVPPTPAPSTNPATTPSLPPADSSPATPAATTTAVPTPTASLPVDSSPAWLPPIPVDSTQLFTEVAPDAMVTLPPAPTDAPQWPTAVWSGTEMITWGVAPNAVGAAFNPATGSWRVTAPSPIAGRLYPTAVWTGTEMIVWGGNPFGGMAADGAAYNPATDTWRRLPDAPLGPGTPDAVWTGDEVVLIGAYHLGETPPTDPSSDATPTSAAAYNPATDEWRPLADLPYVSANAVWTGTSILTTVGLVDAEGNNTNALARYDLSTDTWDIVDDTLYTELVGVPDSDGVARTVIALPSDLGAPVAVLDGDGNSIGSLPSIPADRRRFHDERLAAVGVWAGEEALFWIRRGEEMFVQGEPFEGWALNPATETWRPLPGDHLIPTQLRVGNGDVMVVAGDVVLAWEKSNAADSDEGIAYRAPTTATG